MNMITNPRQQQQQPTRHQPSTISSLLHHNKLSIHNLKMIINPITRKKVKQTRRTTGVSLPEKMWERINHDRGQTLVSRYIQQIIFDYYDYRDKIKSYQGNTELRKAVEE